MLYTDGVTESKKSAGELFGTTRLLDLCYASPAGDSSADANPADDSPTALLAHINSSLTAFTAGTPQSDDITMLAVTYR